MVFHRHMCIVFLPNSLIAILNLPNCLSRGWLRCVGFVELKGVECICLLNILFSLLGLLGALGLLNRPYP